MNAETKKALKLFACEVAQLLADLERCAMHVPPVTKHGNVQSESVVTKLTNLCEAIDKEP